jgi:hypothetical protein
MSGRGVEILRSVAFALGQRSVSNGWQRGMPMSFWMWQEVKIRALLVQVGERLVKVTIQVGTFTLGDICTTAGLWARAAGCGTLHRVSAAWASST